MKDSLLSYPWKFAGIFLCLCGIVLAVFYLWFDFRFTLPVFAVYSSFFETKMFATFRTNFADELTLLLLISGMSLIVFSKEKNETENIDALRLKALTIAVIANNILLLFSVLFIYGTGFLSVLVFNLISFSIFYLLFFYMFQWNEAKRKIVE